MRRLGLRNSGDSTFRMKNGRGCSDNMELVMCLGACIFVTAVETGFAGAAAQTLGILSARASFRYSTGLSNPSNDKYYAALPILLAVCLRREAAIGGHIAGALFAFGTFKASVYAVNSASPIAHRMFKPFNPAEKTPDAINSAKEKIRFNLY